MYIRSCFSYCINDVSHRMTVSSARAWVRSWR